jgi:mercuric ion transport protein
MKRIGVLLGAIVGALAASACCVLPALLGAAGAGTLGLGAALAPYRPYLIALTFLFLTLGFYFTYRPGRGKGCGEECSRGTTRSKRIARVFLWAVTLLTLGVMLYPWAAAYRADQTAAASSRAPASVQLRSVSFAIEKMACAGCTAAIREALRKTPGVYGATVDFKSRRAEVRYDPGRVSVARLKRTIDQFGFSTMEVKEARPRQQSSKSRNSPPLVTLKDGVQSLQRAFNQEAARTRLLLLVSPT